MLGIIRFKIICLNLEENIGPKYMYLYIYVSVYMYTYLYQTGAWLFLHIAMRFRHRYLQVPVSSLDNRQKLEHLFRLKLTFIYFKLPSLMKSKNKKGVSKLIYFPWDTSRKNKHSIKQRSFFLSYELAKLYWCRFGFCDVSILSLSLYL